MVIVTVEYALVKLKGRRAYQPPAKARTPAHYRLLVQEACVRIAGVLGQERYIYELNTYQSQGIWLQGSSQFISLGVRHQYF